MITSKMCIEIKHATSRLGSVKASCNSSTFYSLGAEHVEASYEDGRATGSQQPQLLIHCIKDNCPGLPPRPTVELWQDNCG